MQDSLRVLIQGPRYRVQDIRSASGNTVVLEKSRGYNPQTGREMWQANPFVEVPKPVAGPIFKLSSQPATRSTDIKFYAWCNGCHKTSRKYKRKNEPSIKVWATKHRCGVPEQVKEKKFR